MRFRCITIVGILTLALFSHCNRVSCRNPADCYQKGLDLQKAGKNQQAYAYLSKAAQGEPDNTTYHWAAAQLAPNPQFALFHVKSAWDAGFRTREVLSVYLSFAQSDPKANTLSFAMQLYSQLPDSVRNSDLRAQIFFSFHQFDSALVIWQQVYSAAPSLATAKKIAITLLSVGENGRATAVLMQNRPLDEEGYYLLVNASVRQFDYAGADKAFEDARAAGCFTGRVRISYLQMQIARLDYGKAEALLRQLEQPGVDNQASVSNQQARIALAFVFLETNARQRLDSLRKTVAGDLPAIVAERHYYDLLSRRLTDTAGIADSLSAVLKTMPPYPESDLVLARELARAGNAAAALAIYKRLPDVYIRAPRILVESARLFASIGQENEALALMNAFHSKGLATRLSLELVRDISFKQNHLQDAQKAQAILARQYKGNAGVLYASGMLALKTNQLDTALAIFTELARLYPQENRFKNLRIVIFSLKGDYERVLQECGKLPDSDNDRVRLQARALTKLNRASEADSIYRSACARGKDAGVMVEYAEFLLNNNKPEQSARLYQEIVGDTASRLTKDSSGSAMLLNNLAWSLLQTANPDAKLVLGAASKAHRLAPANPSILDTYAAALLQFQKNNDCIKLLVNDSLAAREPRLLLHLAQAYESAGDLNRMTKTLEQARILLSSANKGVLPAQVDADAIANRINSNRERVSPSKNVSGEATVLSNQARALLQSANPDQKLVLGTASKAYNLAPTDASIINTYAAALLQYGKYGDCIKMLAGNRVTATEPRLLLQLAQAYESAGDLNKAARTLEDAQASFKAAKGTLPSGTDAAAITNRISALRQQIKPAGNGSNDAALLLAQARALLQSANPDQKLLLRTVADAYALSPNDPSVIDTYAAAMLKFGKYNECLKALTGNSALVNKEPRLLLHLAQAYEAKGDLNKAVRTLELAKALISSNNGGALPVEADAGMIAARIKQILDRIK
jgi:predicted Zn-dependent protease